MASRAVWRDICNVAGVDVDASTVSRHRAKKKKEEEEEAPPVGSGAEPQLKSNLVHFILEIWQLVATILMILLRIN